jgi:hypothetical protein
MVGEGLNNKPRYEIGTIFYKYAMATSMLSVKMALCIFLKINNKTFTFRKIFLSLDYFVLIKTKLMDAYN